MFVIQILRHRNMKLKINFSLKSGIEGEKPLIASLNFGYKEFDALKQNYVYKPLRYYTGMKMHKHEWDDELKRPLNKVKYAELLQMEQKINEVFNYLKSHGDVTPDMLKDELDTKLKGKSASQIVTKVRIVDFIRQDIAKSTVLKPKTIANYLGLANKIEKFEEEIGKSIYSNELDEKLYKAFMEFSKKDMNKINAVWSIQKQMKSTLREIARKFKIKVFDPSVELANKDKIRNTKIEAVYFDFEKIQKIIEYQPSTEALKNTKLILLTLIFTGCRLSDVYKIEPKFTYNKGGVKFDYAQYISQKTDTQIIVPILKPLADAIKENGGKTASPISQEAFNVNVKILIEQCKIKEDITLTYIDQNGKKQFMTKMFYELVSSHIGRRSFISNLINYIPLPILTKITGHKISEISEAKNLDVIFGYNQTSLMDNAVLFRKHLSLVVKEHAKVFKVKLI